MMLYYFVFWPTFFVAINGLPKEFQTRIAGGDKTPIELQPYMVSISFGGPTDGQCTGSIISKNLILTAGHCIPKNHGIMKIRAGSDFQRFNGTEHRVESLVLHENYTLIRTNDGGSNAFNDLAVVKVSPAFVFDDTRQPISLFNAEEKVQSGSLAVVSGWGNVPQKQTARWARIDVEFKPLQSVVVPVFEKSFCISELKKKNRSLKPGQMCAGGKGSGACYGDSGAPLVVGGRQVGLVSWGYGCGHTKVPPTVYTEIAYFRKWIDEQAKKLTEYPEVKRTLGVKPNGRMFYQDDNPVWSA